MCVTETQNTTRDFIRVCVGGKKTVDYPLQPMATQETLRNIYAAGHPEFPQSVIDSYNGYTSEINRATWHETREFLLDQRHRYYVHQMYWHRDNAVKVN